MSSLNDDLELLYELNSLRDRAKKLRRGGRAALKGIGDLSLDEKITPKRGGEEKDKDEDKKKDADREGAEAKARAMYEAKAKYYKNWITSGNLVEAALLVRVQRHRDMSDDDKENDDANASHELMKRLETVSLKALFPSLSKTIVPGREGRDENGIEYQDIRIYKNKLDGGKGLITEKYIELVDSTVPVLMAARVMHALVGRAETVFTRATMICYYRIVRELYFAAHPDWIIGAARANAGGDASAFVTGECIRAILAFENAIIRTVAFFRNTRRLLEQHARLQKMLKDFGAGPTHPLKLYADRMIERMWLDWYISTNPRRGEIAVQQVLVDLPPRPDMETVDTYLQGLRDKLFDYADKAFIEIDKARIEIDDIREEQNPREKGAVERKLGYGEEEERIYQQTESAHKMANRTVERGIYETTRAKKEFFKEGMTLEDTLTKFIEQFEEISYRIHRVLEPAKRYVRGVVNRELAHDTTESGRFDAGELAFAAASFGATTDWRKNERLTMACELLTRNLPDSGSLPTRRPFHSNTRGYRLLPIGCEMTRSFAQLLHRTNHEFEPKLVHRMLNIFEEKRIRHTFSGGRAEEGEEYIAWNFEGAPHPERPCVWVTAVAVLALDRIVRMLNERINVIVLKHFEVIRPENPHTNLRLDDLVYSDYGLAKVHNPGGRTTGVRLEQMRAHVERAMLPRAYKDGKGNAERVSSVILYGPPGTGKTTLVEALALSSRAPLIRLSPSDLTVQGHELIEGRARAVFEALAMLTQAVIILDEFEPVLRNRDPAERSPGARSDDPIFNFLVTGMLPKLVKLNEAARKQSLVYCLATNYVKEIDKAAKRPGRFDLHLPVYHPDPLSRAGGFLYCLTSLKETAPAAGDKERERRLVHVVGDTAYATAGELAEVYFKRGSGCGDYYWTAKGEKVSEKENEKEGHDLKEKRLSVDEITQRKTINDWESRVKNPKLKEIGDDLAAYCLKPPDA